MTFPINNKKGTHTQCYLFKRHEYNCTEARSGLTEVLSCASESTQAAQLTHQMVLLLGRSSRTSRGDITIL